MRRWLRDSRGSTSIEYALIASFVFLAIVTSVAALGPALTTIFTNVSSGFSP